MAFGGDFIGFSYNGIHSSEFGIYHVSGGSRYERDLLPTFKDDTIAIPGDDGTLYFGSNYTQRKFQIQIAFDNLTEAQFRKMRRNFGDKKIHDLIFDEDPYKVYRAKVASAPKYKFICFDEPKEKTESVHIIHNHELGADPSTLEPNSSIERIDLSEFNMYVNDSKDVIITYPDITGLKIKIDGDTNELIITNPVKGLTFNIEDGNLVISLVHDENFRIYKGEGTIDFICYYPYAHTPHAQKYINWYLKKENNRNYANTYEWADPNLFLVKQKDYDGGEVATEGGPRYNLSSKIKVYTPGDIPSNFLLYIPFNLSDVEGFSPSQLTVNLKDKEGNILKTLQIGYDEKPIQLQGNDQGFAIDTASHLILGIEIDGDGETSYTGTCYNNFHVKGDFFKIPTSDDIDDYYFITCSNDGVEYNAWIEYDYRWF